MEIGEGNELLIKILGKMYYYIMGAPDYEGKTLDLEALERVANLVPRFILEPEDEEL